MQQLEIPWTNKEVRAFEIDRNLNRSMRRNRTCQWHQVDTLRGDGHPAAHSRTHSVVCSGGPRGRVARAWWTRGAGVVGRWETRKFSHCETRRLIKENQDPKLLEKVLIGIYRRAIDTETASVEERSSTRDWESTRFGKRSTCIYIWTRGSFKAIVEDAIGW